MVNVKITLKLLAFLQEQGYKSILLRFGQDTYVPIFEEMDELMENISMVPLQEDQVISIPDAIAFFVELELSEKEIHNLFENE